MQRERETPILDTGYREDLSSKEVVGKRRPERCERKSRAAHQ